MNRKLLKDRIEISKLFGVIYVNKTVTQRMVLLLYLYKSPEKK